MLFAAAIWR